MAISTGRVNVYSAWDEEGKVNIVHDPTNERVGRVRVEVVNDNVVITVERINESKFGPVSVVVV